MNNDLWNSEKIYVERRIDRLARNNLRKYGFLYIVGPSQCGKTAFLLQERMRQKDQPDTIVVYRDISSSIKEAGPGDTLSAICDRIRFGLQIEGMEAMDRAEPSDANPFATLLLDIDQFLRVSTSKEIFLYLDEINTLSKYPQIVETLLLTLRSTWAEKRQEGAPLERLFVIMAGSVIPIDLLNSKAVTPLNKGVRMIWDDFLTRETHGFISYLENCSERAPMLACLRHEALIDEVFELTKGQPYLTTKMLEQIVDTAQSNHEVLEEFDERQIAKWAYDGLFDEPFFYGETYLASVFERVTGPLDPIDNEALISLYEKVRKNGAIEEDTSDLVHLALVTTGLARRVAFGEGIFDLELRNPVIKERCGQKFIGMARKKLNGDEEPDISALRLSDKESQSDETHSAADFALAEGLVQSFITQYQDRANTRARSWGSELPEEVIPGVLYARKIEVGDNPPRPMSLQIFRGMGHLYRQIWDLEIRILTSLTDSDIPTLPRVEAGSVDQETQTAWVLTQCGDETLAKDDDLIWWRRNPLETLEQFEDFLRALSRLHDSGILHRRICPSTIEIKSNQAKRSLMLSRFEFSTLIYGTSLKSTADTDKGLYQLYIESVTNTDLLHFPPERLFLLLGQEEVHAQESVTSDIYGAGMLFYQLFCTSLQPMKPDELSFKPGEYREEALRTFNQRVRTQLTRMPRNKMPPELAQILSNMISFDPRNRPTADMVLNELQQHRMAIRLKFDDDIVTKPYLAFYALDYSGEELFKYGIINSSPRTKVGATDVQVTISSDLSSSTTRLCYSATGFDEFGSQSSEKTREAKYVLLGTNYTYFCTPYRPKGRNIESSNALFIAYILKYRVPDHRLSKRSQPIHDLEIHPTNTQLGNDEEQIATYPSWERLMLQLNDRRLLGTDTWRHRFFQGLEWLMRMKEAMLSCQAYAAEVLETNGSRATLKVDANRDKIWTNSEPFLDAASANGTRRPDMYAHYDHLLRESESGVLKLRIERADKAEPFRSKSTFLAEFDRAEGHDIIIKYEGTHHLSVGQPVWVYPDNLPGQHVPINRQKAAIEKLGEMPELLTQIQQPKNRLFNIARSRKPGEGLSGIAPLVINDILSNDPFFVLHGPPGTGKTTIIARVILELLRSDPSIRILVTAQSHYAVDNIALRLQTDLDNENLTDQVIAVRLSSEATASRINPEVYRKLDTGQTADSIRATAIKKSRDSMEGDLPHDEIQRLSSWIKILDQNQIDFGQMVKQSANLVFCTTGAANPDILDNVINENMFDWVFIDEAAKAWISELIMPMVYGRRWVLVGDHKQLPAFGMEELHNLLVDASKSEDEDLRLMSKSLQEENSGSSAPPTLLQNLFYPFEHFMQSSAGQKKNVTSRSLNVQYRMAPAIGALISEAFYGRTLENSTVNVSPDDAKKKQAAQSLPKIIHDHQLLWIDTSTQDPSTCVGKPFWFNECEIEIVAKLVGKITGQKKDLKEEIAILSPYKQQIVRLQSALSGLPIEDCIYTVDSFQGREARTVIISLVRTPQHDPSDVSMEPRKAIGFLAHPNRINVMMSRAQEHLIVVGNFKMFSEIGNQHDVHFWKVVCDHFDGTAIQDTDCPRRSCRIIDANELLTEVGGGA